MIPQNGRQPQFRLPKTNPPATPLTNIGLPEHIVARLRSRNLHTIEDWQALSRIRKLAIFGVTRSIARSIDAAITITMDER